MKKRLQFVLFFLISCTSIPQGSCTTDSDCVPATCCHPTNAVTKDNAPDCSEIMCSQECAPGTIDCGQGEIKCIQGQCSAELY